VVKTKQMTNPPVCIVILNWNGQRDTLECLESLQGLSYPNYSVIVVDNASQGDDVKVLRERFNDYVHLIENDANYGFAEGCNIGIRYALAHLAPDYVFLLNNDTVVAPNLLDELVRALEDDPLAAIAGPKTYYYDVNGRKDVIWAAGGKVTWWHPWVYDGIGCNDDDMPRYQTLGTVDWVSGAAMMIKRRIPDDLSLLNAGYFSGNEDVEYCLRARRHGLKVLYVPTARVWHKVGMARPHPTRVTRGSQPANSQNKEGTPRRKHGPRFSDLLPYYRLIRRNFSTPIYVYHLMLLPGMVLHRAAFWMIRRW
jgi:GT2 family glycosyltransferase